LGAAVVLAGCNVVWGIAPLHLDEGADSGPVTGVDSGVPEGAGVADSSGSDGGDWCVTNAPTAVLCEDFDDDDDAATLPGAWASRITGADGELRVQTHVVASAPYALEAISNTATSSYSQADIHRDVDVTPTTLSVAFDVRIDTAEPSSGPYLTFASVALTGPGDAYPYSLGITLDANGLHVLMLPSSPNLGAPVTTFNASGSLTTSSWSRLELDATLDQDAAAPSLSVSLSLNGTTILPPTSASAAGAYGQPELDLGCAFASPSSPSQTVYIDNVVVDAH
jgi:hypothetical protein